MKKSELLSLIKEVIFETKNDANEKDQLTIDMLNKIPEQDVNPEELKRGIHVEMEHTDDKQVARKIALDHLLEDPFYYTHLKAFESEIKLKRKEKDDKDFGAYLKAKEKEEFADQMRELDDKEVKKWKEENVKVYESICNLVKKVLNEKK